MEFNSEALTLSLATKRKKKKGIIYERVRVAKKTCADTATHKCGKRTDTQTFVDRKGRL